MASWSWGLSFFLKPISSKAVELHLDIQLLSRLSLCFVRHGLRRRRRGGGIRIHGWSLSSKFLKLETLENGVPTWCLTEFQGLKQVNPSNCHIPSLFVSLEGKWSEGLDILRERQVKTLRNRRHFYNYFLRKHSEFLTLCVMTTPSSRPAPLSAKYQVLCCILSEEWYLQSFLGVFFAITRWCELVPTLKHVEVKLAFVSKLSRLVNINWTARFYCLIIHFWNIKLG